MCFSADEVFRQGNTLPSPLGWVNALLFTRDNNLVPGTIRKWVSAGLDQPKGGTDDYFEFQRLKELTTAYRAIL